MSIDTKKRQLLAYIIAVKYSPSGLCAIAPANEKWRQRITVAILDIRTEVDSRKFVAALEKEVQHKFPRELEIKFIGIPPSVHNDSGRFRKVLGEQTLFACIAIGSRAANAAAAILDTTPIVFNITGNPAEAGLTLPKYGAGNNITGFTSFAPLDQKRWEILAETFPQIERIIVLAGSRTTQFVEIARTASVHIGKAIDVVAIDMRENMLRQVRLALALKNVAIDLPHTALTSINHHALIDCINETRLPCIFDGTHFVRLGGLLSYEADPLPESKTVAEYLWLLFQGVLAARIPIRAPNTFTLAVNLETATNSRISLGKELLRRANVVFRETTRPERK